MQVGLLALLLLQPERTWTLQELTETLSAPQASVHRELKRAESAGIIVRDDGARPHRFSAAADEPLYGPLAELLRRSVGVEEQLRAVLERPDVVAAAIYGSWAGGSRRPGSDIDLVVVGDADLRELRRRTRAVGKSVGRTIDLTILATDEFQRLLTDRSSFARRLLDGPTKPLVGDLASIARR
ncbi:MAG TPA: nucleotidyltransferase domain-containing protein [Thermoleophilaceae bacterium]